jgi:hypothetical protein
METLSNSHGSAPKNSAQLDFNRFGIISVLIIVVGCLGGIAVGLGAIQSTLALTAVILPTMATLSLLLAVAPMKQILIASSICVLIDISLIVYYLFN